MQEADKIEFSTVLKATMEVFDKKPSADALRIWWAAMANISIQDFRIAMTRHVTTSQFAPKPADILNQFRKNDGRPGAEEAWAMIPKTESESVVWTEEMAVAFGAACPLLEDGDKIGARMAFKEAYEREVSNNADKPPVWKLSPGTDRSGREAALTEAVSKNRLTVDRALLMMPESDQLARLSGQYAPMLGNDNKVMPLIGAILKRDIEQEQEESAITEADEERLLSEVKTVEPRTAA